MDLVENNIITQRDIKDGAWRGASRCDDLTVPIADYELVLSLHSDNVSKDSHDFKHGNNANTRTKLIPGGVISSFSIASYAKNSTLTASTASSRARTASSGPKSTSQDLNTSNIIRQKSNGTRLNSNLSQSDSNTSGTSVSSTSLNPVSKKMVGLSVSGLTQQVQGNYSALTRMQGNTSPKRSTSASRPTSSCHLTRAVGRNTMNISTTSSVASGHFPQKSPSNFGSPPINHKSNPTLNKEKRTSVTNTVSSRIGFHVHAGIRSSSTTTAPPSRTSIPSSSSINPTKSHLSLLATSTINDKKKSSPRKDPLALGSGDMTMSLHNNRSPKHHAVTSHHPNSNFKRLSPSKTISSSPRNTNINKTKNTFSTNGKGIQSSRGAPTPAPLPEFAPMSPRGSILNSPDVASPHSCPRDLHSTFSPPPPVLPCSTSVKQSASPLSRTTIKTVTTPALITVKRSTTTGMKLDHSYISSSNIWPRHHHQSRHIDSFLPVSSPRSVSKPSAINVCGFTVPSSNNTSRIVLPSRVTAMTTTAADRDKTNISMGLREVPTQTGGALLKYGSPKKTTSLNTNTASRSKTAGANFTSRSTIGVPSGLSHRFSTNGPNSNNNFNNSQNTVTVAANKKGSGQASSLSSTTATPRSNIMGQQQIHVQSNNAASNLGKGLTRRGSRHEASLSKSGGVGTGVTCGGQKSNGLQHHQTSRNGKVKSHAVQNDDKKKREQTENSDDNEFKDSVDIEDKDDNLSGKCLSSAPLVLPPEIKADYEMISNNANDLGEGAFALVRTVRHKASGRLLALKMIEKYPLYVRDMLKQLQREVDVQTAAHGHPGILSIVQVCEDDTHVYLLLEFCAYGTLARLQSKFPRRCLPEMLAGWFIWQVLSAVAHLHADHLNLLHRDIKPDNILLSYPSFKTRLCDFGWSAKVMDPISDYGDGSRRSMCGTIEYMAPEVLRLNPGNDAEAADKNSLLPSHGRPADIWTIGILLFELVVGYSPFAHCRPEDRMMNPEPAPFQPSSIPSCISEGPRNLIIKILQQDPRTRPTAIELLSSDPWLASCSPQHYFPPLNSSLLPADVRVAGEGRAWPVIHPLSVVSSLLSAKPLLNETSNTLTSSLNSSTQTKSKERQSNISNASLDANTLVNNSARKVKTHLQTNVNAEPSSQNTQSLQRSEESSSVSQHNRLVPSPSRSNREIKLFCGMKAMAAIPCGGNIAEADKELESIIGNENNSDAILEHQNTPQSALYGTISSNLNDSAVLDGFNTKNPPLNSSHMHIPSLNSGQQHPNSNKNNNSPFLVSSPLNGVAYLHPNFNTDNTSSMNKWSSPMYIADTHLSHAHHKVHPPPNITNLNHTNSAASSTSNTNGFIFTPSTRVANYANYSTNSTYQSSHHNIPCHSQQQQQQPNHHHHPFQINTSSMPQQQNVMMLHHLPAVSKQGGNTVFKRTEASDKFTSANFYQINREDGLSGGGGGILAAGSVPITNDNVAQLYLRENQHHYHHQQILEQHSNMHMYNKNNLSPSRFATTGAIVDSQKVTISA